LHVFGGSVSLIGTILLAPRKDRQGKKFRPVGGNLTPVSISGQHAHTEAAGTVVCEIAAV